MHKFCIKCMHILMQVYPVQLVKSTNSASRVFWPIHERKTPQAQVTKVTTSTFPSQNRMPVIRTYKLTDCCIMHSKGALLVLELVWWWRGVAVPCWCCIPLWPQQWCWSWPLHLVLVVFPSIMRKYSTCTRGGYTSPAAGVLLHWCFY